LLLRDFGLVDFECAQGDGVERALVVVAVLIDFLVAAHQEGTGRNVDHLAGLGFARACEGFAAAAAFASAGLRSSAAAAAARVAAAAVSSGTTGAARAVVAAACVAASDDRSHR
jgi:hypothetical protein